jgi:hypothetical protein
MFLLIFIGEREREEREKGERRGRQHDDKSWTEPCYQDGGTRTKSECDSFTES